MTPVKIGSHSDFPDGSVKTVSVNEISVLIASVAGEIYATESKCPHQGFPLEGARREGFILICRLHGAQYALRTGKRVKGYPTRDLRTFPVSVEGEDVFIDV